MIITFEYDPNRPHWAGGKITLQMEAGKALERLAEMEQEYAALQRYEDCAKVRDYANQIKAEMKAKNVTYPT